MAESKKKVSKKVVSKKKVVARKKAASKKKVSASAKKASDKMTAGESPAETVPIDEEQGIETPAEPVNNESGVAEAPFAGAQATKETDREDAKPVHEEPSSPREKAAASRKALFEQLRADFRAGRNSLIAAGSAARKEAILFKDVAVNELEVVKNRFDSLANREDSPFYGGREKARKILSTGRSWGEQQLNRTKQAVEKVRDKFKK